jgi:hypothetical protein
MGTPSPQFLSLECLLLLGFDPAKFTAAKLRGILVAHQVIYPPTAKKAQLVALFNEHVATLIAETLAATEEVTKSYDGIEGGGVRSMNIYSLDSVL